MTIRDWFFRHTGELAARETSAGVKQTLLTAAEEAGFDSIVAGEIDLDDRRRTHFIINTWPKAWMDYYAREKAFEYDPLISRLSDKPQCLTWAEIAPGNRRERQLMDAARQFGWADGLALAIPRANNLVGIVSLTSKQLVPGGEWRQMVSLFVTLAYEKLRGLTNGTTCQSLVGLTSREVECLELIARGATDAEIGRGLGIAVHTAHEHVERAKKRLGCRSRAQLVAVAVALGLVSP